MSNRKETPDLLGEILNGPAKSAASAQIEPMAETDPSPKPTETRTSSKPKPKTSARKPSSRWEYMEVVFREFHGWRPRYVDGNELADWKEQPEIADFLNQLGQDGWEMVGIVNARRNMRDAYFRRLSA